MAGCPNSFILLNSFSSLLCYTIRTFTSNISGSIHLILVIDTFPESSPKALCAWGIIFSLCGFKCAYDIKISYELRLPQFYMGMVFYESSGIVCACGSCSVTLFVHAHNLAWIMCGEAYIQWLVMELDMSALLGFLWMCTIVHTSVHTCTTLCACTCTQSCTLTWTLSETHDVGYQFHEQIARITKMCISISKTVIYFYTLHAILLYDQ